MSRPGFRDSRSRASLCDPPPGREQGARSGEVEGSARRGDRHTQSSVGAAGARPYATDQRPEKPELGDVLKQLRKKTQPPMSSVRARTGLPSSPSNVTWTSRELAFASRPAINTLAIGQSSRNFASPVALHRDPRAGHTNAMCGRRYIHFRSPRPDPSAAIAPATTPNDDRKKGASDEPPEPDAREQRPDGNEHQRAPGHREGDLALFLLVDEPLAEILVDLLELGRRAGREEPAAGAPGRPPGAAGGATGTASCCVAAAGVITTPPEPPCRERRSRPGCRPCAPQRPPAPAACPRSGCRRRTRGSRPEDAARPACSGRPPSRHLDRRVDAVPERRCLRLRLRRHGLGDLVVQVGRRQPDRNVVGERDDGDPVLGREIVRELDRGRTGREEPGGRDVLRSHRAGDVEREHDRRALPHLAQTGLRPGEADEQERQAEQEQDRRNVAAAAGRPLDHVREQRRRRPGGRAHARGGARAAGSPLTASGTASRPSRSCGEAKLTGRSCAGTRRAAGASRPRSRARRAARRPT